MENENRGNIFLLGLPESTLDSILKKLSPTELCSISEVCTTLRDRSRSNHLWEEHIKRKWGRVMGDVVYHEWQWHIATAKNESPLNQRDQNGSLGSFTGVWPYVCLGSYLKDCSQLCGTLSNNPMMALYFSLESGRFWFPAQVYKDRGWMQDCYDALLSYDSKTDTFQARQRHDYWRFINKNIKWDLVRAPPVESHPYFLHVSDCLDNLVPGDHIEIQRRASGETPYNWLYARIGHLESCDKNKNHCGCHCSEMLVVEFKEYSSASAVKRLVVSRKNYREEGERTGGSYGGIRKLHSEEEIERWNKLTASQVVHVHRCRLRGAGSRVGRMLPNLILSMPPVAAQFPIP